MNNKYNYGTAENTAFLNEQRENLFEFGRNFPAPTGSSYYLWDDGTPAKDRPRETWITSRMVHVYSLALLSGHTWAAELVDAGLKGLSGELKDEAHGGWYAGVYADGTPMPGKACYAHAFVILAASSALQAGRPGAKELLDEALAVYDRYFWDEEAGLAVDGWDTDFTVPDDYRGINSNMHTVEAFLAVADVTGDEKYRTRAGRIIGHVREWAARNSYRLPEHFSADWRVLKEYNSDKKDDPFKPYGATPGHGIEWARLMLQWGGADCLADAENLYNRAMEDGWCADGGRGLVYTTDWDGKPVVHDRMHWTLAEAINTSSILWRMTGKEKYAEDYSALMRYLDEVVIDYKNGSWFHQLDKDGNVLTTVWPGKSDLYHAVQSMIIPYEDDVRVSVIKAF